MNRAVAENAVVRILRDGPLGTRAISGRMHAEPSRVAAILRDLRDAGVVVDRALPREANKKAPRTEWRLA